MLKILSLVFGICVCNVAIAKDCEEGATTQGDVIACVYETEFEPLERKVETEYQKLLQMVPNQTDTGVNIREDLVNTQTAWTKYRDATCDFVWDLAGGATVVWGERLGCLIDFNQARIKSLQGYQKAIQNSNQWSIAMIHDMDLK